MMELAPVAHFDGTASAIIVEGLTVRDQDVVREGRRWTNGERGPVVDDRALLADADLTPYVTEALRLGAHALSVTGQAQEARALDRMVREVGEKTADSTAKAAEATERAARAAAEVVGRAAAEAKRAITEADTQSRDELTKAVSRAKQELTAEVGRLFGGESPELLDRLNPVLDKFGSDLDTKVSARTSELLEKTAKQFDPTDPASPMAKHTADLTANQERLAGQLKTGYTELAAKVDELTTALRIQEARKSLVNVTPIKGDAYAEQIHKLMADIATGLGDEYADTSELAGHIARCKKGDGLLTIDAGAARVVVEMSDSARADWNGYLDVSERNRDAAASLGLVRFPGQNGDQAIRVIGPRRVVLAFDPGTDDPDQLRTAVQLLRTAALAAAARNGARDLTTVREKIDEALAQLAKIDSIKKLAGSVHKNALKIDSECTTLNTGIRRLLDEATDALSGAQPPGAGPDRS